MAKKEGKQEEFAIHLNEEQKMLIAKQQEKMDCLLGNIKREKSSLEQLLTKIEDHWGEEDMVYRFYHDSFKVYRIQGLTDEIYEALKRISPHENKEITNEYYENVIKRSRLKSKEQLDNSKWDENCRPLLEAFFHSKYFLSMAVKCGKRYVHYKHAPHAPQRVYSGWAALLELYGIR